MPCRTPPLASNVRGTCSVAHWDVPDCGNTEFFINLKPNPHLDEAYGGYCVFAAVRPCSASEAARGILRMRELRTRTLQRILRTLRCRLEAAAGTDSDGRHTPWHRSERRPQLASSLARTKAVHHSRRSDG